MKMHVPNVLLCALALFSLTSFGAELPYDCVDCKKDSIGVEVQPDRKSVVDLRRAVALPMALASTSSLVITKANKIDSKESYQYVYCEKYQMCEDKYDLKELIKEVEATPYSDSIIEFWTKPACSARKKTDMLVPILYNSVNDVYRTEKFPSVVYDYFVNKKKDPQSWLKAINTKTSEGFTFLDFLQFNIDRNNYSTPETMDAALRIVSYLCKNGGVYSKYESSKKCP